MGEDKECDGGMDMSDASARVPPKMRKGWIKKNVPLAASGKQSVERLREGKLKQKETVGMGSEMDSASTPSSGVGAQKLTIYFQVRYHQSLH